MPWHADQVGVGAADHQPKLRRLEVVLGEHRGVDVAPEVVDAGDGLVPRRGEAFGDPDANEQTPDKAGSAGDREQVDVGRSHGGLVESPVQKERKAFQVVAGRELGDDATELLVHVDLGVDEIGEDPAAVLDHRDGGFVA